MLEKKNRKIKIILSVLLINFLSMGFLFADDSMGQLGQIDYLYLLRTNFVMIALLILSLVSLAFIIERIIYFRSIRVSSKEFMQVVKEYIDKKDFDGLIKMCSEEISPLSVAVKTLVENKERSKEEMEELFDIVRAREKEDMEKFMVVLGSSAAVSPLLGLLGTVTGIIKAFADLAASGSGGPSVVAAGVSEALVTTAFGLIIAIPVLLVYNSFNTKIRNIVSNLEVNARTLFFMLEENK